MASRLQLIVDAETKKAQKNLRNLQKSIDSTGKQTKKSNVFLQTFAGFFTAQTVLGGIKTIASTIKELGTNAIATAASFEQQQLQFGVLLQDVERGNELFEELKEFAATTPLQLDTVATGSKRLLAFGVASEDVIDTLQVLGDVSLGNAATLDRITDAYGKMLAKGKVTLEELNRFTEAGIPVLQELADQMGITTNAVYDLISDGALAFDDVNTALQSLTAEGGNFNNLMQKSSETLAGKWSTLKDVFSQVGASIAENVTPFLKDAMNTAINLGNKLLGDTEKKQLFTAIAEGTVEGSKNIQEAIQLIEKEFTNYISVAEHLGISTKGIKKNLAGVEELMSRAQKKFLVKPGSLLVSYNNLQKSISQNILLQGKLNVAIKEQEERKIAKEQEEANKALTQYLHLLDTVSSEHITEKEILAEKIAQEKERLLQLENQLALLQQQGIIEIQYIEKSEALQTKIKNSIADMTAEYKAMGEVVETTTKHIQTQEAIIIGNFAITKTGLTDMVAATQKAEQEKQRLQSETANHQQQLIQQQVSQYSNMTNQIYGQFSGVFDQVIALQRNQTQITSNQLQQEIDEFVAAKDEKIAAYMEEGLSKEHAEKKFAQEKAKLEKQKKKTENEANRKAFEQNKAKSIIDVLIAGAVGSAAAWKFGNPAISLPIIAAIAAATIANSTLIAAQKYPGLYQGGIVPPQGNDGTLFRLGDKNTREIVYPIAPFKKDLKKIITENTPPRMYQTNITLHVDGFVGNEDQLAEKIDTLLHTYRQEGRGYE